MPETYYTARAISRKTDLPVEQIIAEADMIGVGRKGAYSNSPRVFSEQEGCKIIDSIYGRRIAKAKAEHDDLLAETHKNFSRMAALASLARAQGNDEIADILEQMQAELKNLPAAPRGRALTDPSFRGKYFAALTGAKAEARFAKLQALSAETRKYCRPYSA